MMGQRRYYRRRNGTSIWLDEDDLGIAEIMRDEGERPTEIVRQLKASGTRTTEAVAAVTMAKFGYEVIR